MPHRPRLVVLVFVWAALLFGSRAALAQASADLSVLKADSPDPVLAGSSLTWTISVDNEGPDNADNVTLTDTLPAGTTFQSLSAPGGWSCTTPAVGSGGTVSCSIASFPPGGAIFTLTVAVGAGVADGTVLSNTATVTSSTSDPNPGGESATADTTVTALPQTTISITKVGAPDPVLTGSNLTYSITATNAGAADLEDAAVSDPLPAGTTFVSLTAPAGWTCTTPAVGAPGTVSCTLAPWPPGSAVFTLVVRVAGTVPGGTNLVNTASLTVVDNGRTTIQDATATTPVASTAPLEIPALGPPGLALLGLALALAGALLAGRRLAG